MACLRFGFTTAFNYVSGPPAEPGGDAAPFQGPSPAPGRLLSNHRRRQGRREGRRSRHNAAPTLSGTFSSFPLAGMARALLLGDAVATAFAGSRAATRGRMGPAVSLWTGRDGGEDGFGRGADVGSTRAEWRGWAACAP